MWISSPINIFLYMDLSHFSCSHWSFQFYSGGQMCLWARECRGVRWWRRWRKEQNECYFHQSEPQAAAGPQVMTWGFKFSVNWCLFFPLNKTRVHFLSLLCNVVSLKNSEGETPESNVLNLPSGLLEPGLGSVLEGPFLESSGLGTLKWLKQLICILKLIMHTNHLGSGKMKIPIRQGCC